MWRAIALIWMGALVEPPIALLTAMAFSKAARVRTFTGVRSSWIIATILRPLS